ncbi:DNA topoisomerase 2 [Massospora cicadina]|nr:DNA topoisomerase 2 [Massospora cicadina]
MNSEAPMAPEGGAPTLAPIFNVNPYSGPTMTKIKVTIDPEQNLISVYKNGSGIPVEIHKGEKVYIPKLIFGHLLTSSNYDDSEKKMVEGDSTNALTVKARTLLGQDYYGVYPLFKADKKLTNIFMIMGFNSLVDNSDISKLRCEHLMIMMDQDLDGQFHPDTFIDQSGESITYADFINKELILFFFDGLKSSQCKVVYDCFLWPDSEIMVTTLISSIKRKMGYYHRDQSLVSTIIGLAQNFVGANNVNLLTPLASTAHYSRTHLKPFTQLLFHKDAILLFKYLDEVGMKLEPEFFVLVVPIILLNGVNGIGTRWSTNIVSYNLADVFSNLQQLMQGKSLSPCCPGTLGFTGNIKPSSSNCYMVQGRILKLDDQYYEITELPIGLWPKAYDSMLENWHLNSNIIKDYEKYPIDMGLRYII